VFLDSNGITGLVNKTGVPDVDWVTKSQVTLLKDALLTDPTIVTDNSTNSTVSTVSTVPTYVFVHIPPQFRPPRQVSELHWASRDETDIGVPERGQGGCGETP